MKNFLIGLLLFVSVLGIQAQFSTCDAGAVVREQYPSATLGQQMFYSVYTPPCYDATQSYPVIYLMHGSNEDDGHWIRLGLPQLLDQHIADGTMPPIIAVLPFGNVIANRNRFDTLSWQNIFLTELIPHAESRYAIQQDRFFRAIGGISRGGFWAFQIAFRAPERFAIVGGHSAFFDLGNAPDDFNPLALAQTAPDLATLRIWLDYGANDFAKPGLDLMHGFLSERGLAHQFQTYPEGEHNNLYWGAHLEAYLRFYTETWRDVPPTAPIGFATNTPIAIESTPLTMTPLTTDSSLFLPVVAFPSLITTISLAELRAISAGTYNENLILTDSVQSQLQALGVAIHPQTQVIATDQLQAILWRERDYFSLLPIDQMTPRLRILFVDDRPVLDRADYPFRFGTADDGITRFTFSGVTALTRQTRTALNAYGLEHATSAIMDYVQSADVFHLSNEVSFVQGCPQGTELLGGASSFCADPAHYELLTILGVEVIELTGNHNNDYGYEPYRETLARYRNSGFATIGGGNTVAESQAPFIYTDETQSIALLACNAVGPYYALVNEDPTLLGGQRSGATPCDWAWLEQILPALADQVDVVIVTVQYQEVEDYLPTESQQIDFRRLANLGADVVLGTSNHKPQTYEFYRTRDGRDSFIHYGMGNFYFDQPFWGNMRFFLNTLYIQDGILRSVEIFPGIIDDLVRPRLMTPDERMNFLFFMFVQQNGF